MSDSPPDFYELRPFEQENDLAAVAGIVGAAYQEHGDPGIDLRGYDSDLSQVDTAYRAKGGEFVVLKWRGKVVGSHATLPLESEPGLLTFRRLYLDATHRGTGAGDKLMQWALDWAGEHQFRRVEFWSDTRFARAHRFFDRFGFAKTGAIRECHDYLVPYSEFHFALNL
jgi:putative acetyltransferase